MAQDIFLKINGIDGESQDASHKNEVEVLNWSWKIEQLSTMHSGSGGGAGKATVAELLKDEIARGVVTVNEDAKHSAVIFRGDDMFAAGHADVNAKVQPLLDKVAAEIAKVPGKVTVTGHSDNQPIRTARFPSNQVLSEERAAHVSEDLASKGVAQGRLEAIGKGDTEPVADNTTSDGRAKNRRVEIDVTQQ